MSGNEPEKKGSKGISVFNWMLTLLACSIPGVNLISFILFIIFARTRSKRRFATAGLILELIVIVLCVAALIAFPDEIRDFARSLNQTAEPLS